MNKKSLAAIIAFSILGAGIIGAYKMYKAPSKTPAPQTEQATPEPPKDIPVYGEDDPSIPKIAGKIFMVALDDNGKTGKQIGCGDSLIPVDVQIKESDKPSVQVTNALEKLLSIKTQFYGQSGLYNSLYQSDLKLDSVGISGENTTVHLSGTMALGGVCDNPRFAEQIKTTINQFPEVKNLKIFINNKTLEETLSLK